MPFDNPQNEVYEAVVALATAALNPGWHYDVPTQQWTNGTISQNAPPIPVVQDMQDEGAPSTHEYLVVQQTPTMDRIGLGPSSTQQDSTGKRALVQGYTAQVKMWECNGTGSLILRVQDFSETDEGQAILNNTHVAILDFGEVREFSVQLDGRYFTQIQSSITCTIATSTEETLSYINTLNATGTLN